MADWDIDERFFSDEDNSAIDEYVDYDGIIIEDQIDDCIISMKSLCHEYNNSRFLKSNKSFDLLKELYIKCKNRK